MTYLDYVGIFLFGVLAGVAGLPFILWENYTYRITERRSVLNDHRGFWRYTWDTFTK